MRVAWVPSKGAATVVGTVLAQRQNGDLRVRATARRMHIRRRVAVLRKSPVFRGLRPASPPTAAALGTFGCSSRCCGASVSLPFPAPPLPAPSRRYAPQYFVAGMPAPRPATCSAPKSPNRAGACHSARHSAPRPAPQSTWAGLSLSAVILAFSHKEASVTAEGCTPGASTGEAASRAMEAR